MIRVLVAEDSSTVRALLVEMLHSDPSLLVVGEARDGAEALKLTRSLRPDVVLMDVQMPVMDGFEATREIMIHVPTPIVVITSSTLRREVDLSLDATAAGALAFLRKPDDPRAAGFPAQRDGLLTTVKTMAQVKVVRRWARRTPTAGTPAADSRPRSPSARPRIVAIAASTGGPAALKEVLRSIPPGFEAPILAVQHIAAGFVGGLASWLASECRLRVKIAEAGEHLVRGTVYLAPDGAHLGVTATGTVVLAADEPLDGFRPSATYLFESVAAVYGSAAVAVVMTGMGSDGVRGLQTVAAAGGFIVAQDEASCVVYGMPQEAVRAGVVDAVIPLDRIADRLMTFVTEGVR